MNEPWEDYKRLKAQVEAIRAQVDQLAGARRTLVVPSVAEFVLGRDYLAQPKIFPKQLTMLRTMFCEVESLTDYDRAVLADWGSGFVLPGTTAHDGVLGYEPAPDRPHTQGTTPDIVERMHTNRRNGRRWFRENNMVVGRRGGKGHIAANAISYLIWQLLCLKDPHDYFGIPPHKKITVLVFAGNLEQARFNVFADIAATLIEAPCMAPFLGKLSKDRLEIRTPAEVARGQESGGIVIMAKEATSNAGRGSACIAQVYDEMAFVDPSTSKASAESIYGSATPATDQFGEWAMLIEVSSPWQQTGEFYAIHRRALEVDPATGTAAYPELWTLQLPSWVPYEDHDIAEATEMCTAADAAHFPALADPTGRPRTFPKVGRPFSVYDHQMRQIERANPYDFDRERRAQWGTVAHPYLNFIHIEGLWLPYRGETLTMQEQGILARDYIVVIDPAGMTDAFAWIVAHRDPVDPTGRPHVVYDLIRRFLPPKDGELDSDKILNQLAEDIAAFDAIDVITDGYGGIFVRQDLQRRINQLNLRSRPQVRDLGRNRHRNLATAELFREAIYLRQIHSYYDTHLDQELRFLQETPAGVSAPGSGPVQHDDVAFCAMVAVEVLLGEAASQPIHDAVADTGIRGIAFQPTNDHDATIVGQMGNSVARSRRLPRVGQRARPAGPKRLPRGY